MVKTLLNITKHSIGIVVTSIEIVHLKLKIKQLKKLKQYKQEKIFIESLEDKSKEPQNAEKPNTHDNS